MLEALKLKPLGPRGFLVSHFFLKKSRKQPTMPAAGQSRAPNRGAFPKDKSVFKQRSQLSGLWRALSACRATSLSCTRFLYSIFLVLVVSRLLRVGSDPTSQGLACLPPSLKCALCPVPDPTPTTTTSISLVAWRTAPLPQPAQQVPSWPLPPELPIPAATLSRE